MTRKTSPARREAFFKALAETGNQTIAAERAKVSRSWMTLHRASDPAFRARMEAAVAEARAALSARSGGVRPPSGWGSLDGEELVVRAGNGRRVQIARARLKGWTPRLETRFLTTLAATCNVKAACAEIGLSAASAYVHAERWPNFAARWRAAIEEGYFRIEMQLLERAMPSLSPGGPEPAIAEVATPALSDEAAIQQLYLHRHDVSGEGGKPGRPARQRLEARDEMIRALQRNLDRIERRKRDADRADPVVQARDRREWARRDR